MKALFLAALILACANAIELIPNAFLGNWNAIGSTCNFICVQTINFGTDIVDDLTLTLTGSPNANSNLCNYGSNGYFDLNSYETSSSVSSPFNLTITLTTDAGSEFTANFALEANSTTLTANFENGGCYTTYDKSAHFIKATFGAIIAAAFMLF